MKKNIVILFLCFLFGQSYAQTLVTPSPTPEAVALFRYINDMYGKKILSGQMDSPWGVNELSYIQTYTGKQPAIRGLDFITESDNNGEVQRAIDWWRSGGIPTIMWHMGAPGKGEGYTSSQLTIDINRVFQPGTAEYTAFWNELKIKADHLQKLKTANVPVIWRPFHELSGNWFWWSKGGPEQFKRLWIAMYNYMVVERQLNNMIWVLCYSGSPSGSWFPGKQYVDIAGADTYASGTGPQLAMYNATKNSVGGNSMPIAYHECGTPPDPDQCLSQGAMWSWWMEWHTTHLEGVDRAYLSRVYNHNLINTRDEVPNIMLVYGGTTNNPPTVSLTAPANNASFIAPASITISANASDANGTVSNIQFYNGTTLLNTDATAPYSFSWTGVGVGTYSITARATDNAGAVTTSTAVSVTVTGTTTNTPPTVSISSPSNNASFTAPAGIAITANAADANGTVSNVQFYNGATLLGSDATAPYSLSWTGVGAGTYSLTARATDNAGAVTTSVAVSVTVTGGSTSTADIIGPDCGANNTTLTFELNTSKRANVTSYNWWYTGSAASTAAVVGSPFRVTVQTGGSFSAGQVCVGTNLSIAPWHTTYCKSITKCSGAREGLEDLSMGEIMNTTVSPNPSTGSFTLLAAEEIQWYTVISNLGTVVLKGSSIVSGQSVIFGESLNSGLYTLRIQYTSGRVETKTIQKAL